MATIKVQEVTRREVEVEVSFPIYSKHDLLLDECDSVDYRRWDADGTLWSVQRTIDYHSGGSRDKSFEITKGFRDANGRAAYQEDRNYLLGLGDYACTAAEFADVLREAREFLAGIDGTAK